MKYIDWKHIDDINLRVTRRVFETCTNHGTQDPMGFQYDWNKEIVAQFHTAYFHDVPNDTIHWMTDITHHKFDFVTFACILGFGSSDRNVDVLRN